MVVVDLTGSGESVARIRGLIRDINICTRGDGIHVLGRRVADIGNALSIVTRQRGLPDGRHLQLAVQEPSPDDRSVSFGSDALSGRDGVRLDEGRAAPSLPTLHSSPPFRTEA